MARIQELLKGKYGQLDFAELLSAHPWLTKPRVKCILSPDSDGLLSGLFMSHHFGWEVVGFYDTKVLVLRSDLTCRSDDVAFLDVEVFREGVQSMGHHMLALRSARVPPHWDTAFAKCVNPHLFRGYDAKSFRLKYPLANIHLLLAIVGSQQHIEIPASAISALLFTDGTFNVLYRYPENVLNWLQYLGIDNPGNPLRTIFQQEHYTVYKLMEAMDRFFRRRDEVSIPNERGDRLRISATSGEPYNLTPASAELYKLDESARTRLERFIAILSDATGWEYRADAWTFTDWKLRTFSKSDFVKQGWTTSIRDFDKLMGLAPLSWAMTSGNNIEFTLELPDQLP